MTNFVHARKVRECGCLNWCVWKLGAATEPAASATDCESKGFLIQQSHQTNGKTACDNCLRVSASKIGISTVAI